MKIAVNPKFKAVPELCATEHPNIKMYCMISQDKVVKDVMTGLDKVFMMELSARLNFQLMFSIYKSGFTRIPVYETYRQNVVGILFVKVSSHFRGCQRPHRNDSCMPISASQRGRSLHSILLYASF